MSKYEDEGVSLGMAYISKETEKALLCVTEEYGERWIPKVAVHDDSEVWGTGQGKGKLVVKMWWAEKNDLV